VRLVGSLVRCKAGQCPAASVSATESPSALASSPPPQREGVSLVDVSMSTPNPEPGRQSQSKGSLPPGGGRGEGSPRQSANPPCKPPSHNFSVKRGTLWSPAPRCIRRPVWWEQGSPPLLIVPGQRAIFRDGPAFGGPQSDGPAREHVSRSRRGPRSHGGRGGPAGIPGGRRSTCGSPLR
jgi:hypothetical protein